MCRVDTARQRRIIMRSTAIAQAALDSLARLLEFQGSAAGTQRGDPKAWGSASYDCLKSLIAIVEATLKAAPAYMTLREFLGHAISTLPAKEYLQEARDDIRHQVLRGSQIGGKASILLNRDCNPIGDQLGHIRYVLSGGLARMYEQLAANVAPNVEDEEGPVESGVFAWKRKRYPFSSRQWALLEALWHESYLPEKESRRGTDRKGQVITVHEEWVLDAVYGDADARPNALWQLQIRTQDKLDEYRLPFQISRPSRRSLRLKKRRSLTAS
jgi:hypothetical protein